MSRPETDLTPRYDELDHVFRETALCRWPEELQEGLRNLFEVVEVGLEHYDKPEGYNWEASDLHAAAVDLRRISEFLEEQCRELHRIRQHPELRERIAARAYQVRSIAAALTAERWPADPTETPRDNPR